MKMVLNIVELNNGKRHKRTLPYRSCEASFKTTRSGNRFIVVTDYYSGEIIKKVNINKYGSCECWIDRFED